MLLFGEELWLNFRYICNYLSSSNPTTNSRMSPSGMITRSFMLSSFLLMSARGFCRTTSPSMQTLSGRTSLGRSSPLYFVDHDPIEEKCIKHQPVSAIVATDTYGTKRCTKPKRESSTKKQSTKSKPGIQDRTWNAQYQALLEFKGLHGHCIVPQNYPPNPKLGLWVMAQRRYFKEKKDLTERHRLRHKRLREAGFSFNVDRRGPRMAKLVNSNSPRRNSIEDMDDFVGFLVKNEDVISEKEMSDAWKLRFSIYQK